MLLQVSEKICFLVIRMNWSFKCVTACVNKSSPHLFWDVSVISLETTDNVRSLCGLHCALYSWSCNPVSPSLSKPSNKTWDFVPLLWCWCQLSWIQLHWCGVFPLWITQLHTPKLTNTASQWTWMGEELISDLICPGSGTIWRIRNYFRCLFCVCASMWNGLDALVTNLQTSLRFTHYFHVAFNINE